ncbi:hypothetical protein QAD02_005636 [Eretmocerus hayati]|uniref:Uncharacterized protein n=1 Tax=Eretmocerus hayati TaxID=131215 RepID=A0ACC2NVQ4_9HYME|nr:hypothetical protein QAD02_005636 [Eretmocerus hayati]
MFSKTEVRTPPAMKSERSIVADMNFDIGVLIENFQADEHQGVIIETETFCIENGHMGKIMVNFPPKGAAQEDSISVIFRVKWGPIALPYHDFLEIGISFSIEDVRGQLVNEMKTHEMRFCGDGAEWMIKNYIKRDKLLDPDEKLLRKLPHGGSAFYLRMSSCCIQTRSELLPKMGHDFRLRTGDGGDFPVNKSVLQSKSSLFADMIASCNRKNSREIIFRKVSKSVMEETLRFMYTGHFFMIKKQFHELVVVAVAFEITDLKDYICFMLIGDQLKIETAGICLRVADNLKCQKWKEQILLFIIYNAKEYIKTKDYQEIAEKHPKLICAILERMVSQS